MSRAILAVVLSLTGTVAFAQTPGTKGVVEALQAQGYTGIEVGKPQGGKITVEGYRDGAERKLVYDARTGKLLSDDSHADDHAKGGATAATHDQGDDHGGASGGSDDHGSDDHGGGNSGSDDHGGGSSGGSDDHGGGSSGGSDDHGGSSGGHGSDDY